jgi:competence protein ComEA
VKAPINRQVALSWLLLVAIVCGAAVIVWKVAVLDAPPSGALFIQSALDFDAPSATITPYGGSVSAAAEPTVQTSEAVIAIPISTATAEIPSQPTLATPTPIMISVYVSGAVVKPGVYSVPDGSRVESAVSAAGGPLPDADLDQINLAAKLTDEAHITVYHKGEAPVADAGVLSLDGATPGSPTAQVQATPRPTRSQVAQTPARPTNVPPKPTPRVKININTATAVELEQIPGIGPALAQRIITDRETNGPFKSVEDLTRVSGIKEGILAKLRNYVTVGP